MFRPRPSACSPYLCAHGARQCARHPCSHPSFCPPAPASWAPPPPRSPPAPSSVLPLLPPFSLPPGTMHDSWLNRTLACSPHLRHLWASDALPAACTAPAAFTAAGGLSVRGAPGRGILPPAFRPVPHLCATVPVCANHAYHSLVPARVTARKMHNTLHGMPPFVVLVPSLAPFSCPWPFVCPFCSSCSVYSLSDTPDAQHFAGHFPFPRLALAPPFVLAVSSLPLPLSLRAW